MIPQYQPTFEWADLVSGFRDSGVEGCQETLRTFLSAYYDRRHVFFFHGARVALYALLHAYERPGDVLLPAYTCIAVPEAIVYANYRPVFVDVEEGSVNAGSDGIVASLSASTRVVVATHQFGLPCDIQTIQQRCRGRGVLVVEDAAAAFGATLDGRLVGTFGDAAILSFHTTKVVSGGIGGALLLDDDTLASKIERIARQSKGAENPWSSFARAAAWKIATHAQLYPLVHLLRRLLRGQASMEIVTARQKMPADFVRKCSDFCASSILKQVDRLEENLQHRRSLAHLYAEALSENGFGKLPAVPPNCSPSWIQFPVLIEDKKAFLCHLRRHGIDPSQTFRYCCPDSFGIKGFPNARRVTQTLVGLPTYPTLSNQQALEVREALRSYRARCARQAGPAALPSSVEDTCELRRVR